MIDTSLLNKDGPITIEDMKEQFRLNDFSAMSSGYNKGKESDAHNTLFNKIVAHFKKAWRGQLHEMTGKYLSVFSASSPIGCMEKSESELVAGTLVHIIDDETKLDQLFDIGLTVLRKPIEAELEKLAQEQEKTAEELTEEEFKAVLDQLADKFLNKMMRLLLETQEVDKWLSFTNEMPAEEDFNKQLKENLDYVDFRRQWYHLQTKIGAMLSLEDVPENAYADPDLLYVIPDPKQRAIDDEKFDLLVQQFCEYLNDDVDSQIVYMTMEGLTQKQMAERLGFRTHSAVSKRLKKLFDKCNTFRETLEKAETDKE